MFGWRRSRKDDIANDLYPQPSALECWVDDFACSSRAEMLATEIELVTLTEVALEKVGVYHTDQEPTDEQAAQVKALVFEWVERLRELD